MELQVSNPNDFKVVDFHNPTDFTFTPEMGCMYDSRPIFGITGAPGINAGETLKLPYYIGQQLAINLAKVVLTREAPTIDPAGIPTGVPLWDTARLEALKNSFLKELYQEEKPVAQSETDKLMAKVEEYKKMVDTLVANAPTQATVAPLTQFSDKQEVIAELEKRGIPHDKRKNKAELSKLLA